MAKRPGLTTIKTLFAHSCNRCAFPGCDNRLTDPQWGGVKADIAHIHGEKPTAARYVEEMTDDERNAIDNLMLLCPNHHREIDRLRPQDWSAETLMDLKANHEAECRHDEWASDAFFEFSAGLLLGQERDADKPTSPVEQPRLRAEQGGTSRDAFTIVNAGNADAFDVTVTEAPGSGAGMLVLPDAPMARLSPGGRWEAGLVARSMSDVGSPVVCVSWKDVLGNAYDGEFPL